MLKIFRIIENWIVWRGKKFSFLSILVYFITELFYAARAALMTTVYLLLEYQVQAQRNNQFNDPSNMTRASFNLSIAFSIAFPFPGVGLVTGAGVTAPTGAGIPSTFIYCCLCVDFIGTLFFFVPSSVRTSLYVRYGNNLFCPGPFCHQSDKMLNR